MMLKPPAKLKLLAIVDDWEALSVYEDRLGGTAGPFDVECAPFGSEGIRMVQEAGSQRFHRILIDLTMDDMHGAEACELLRAPSAGSSTSIPITVILNAGESAWERAGEFPLERDQIIHRPFEFSVLGSLLTK